MNDIIEFTRYDKHNFYFKNGAPDYTIFEKKLVVLDSISAVANSSIYIRDFYKKSYPYFSKISQHLTGYTQDEFYDFGSEIYTKLLSKDDLYFLQEVEHKVFELIYSFEENRRSSYVITISHNIIHKDGDIVPVNIYITPFLFDDNFNIWMNLVRITFARKNQKNNQFLYLDMLDTKERYIYNAQKKNFDTCEMPRLTHMEKSILVLCIKGYMEKEIASDLDISVNTVKTHKRNFLRKLEAQNMQEAFIMATIHKLI